MSTPGGKDYGTLLPRPHPAGGYYCEHGTMTANSCKHRAVWRRADVPIEKVARRPGSVLCSDHLPDHGYRSGLWVTL